MQRRERVVGNSRLGLGHRRNQRRLAGIGHSEQANIGKYFEFECQVAPFAGRSIGRLPGRAVRTTLEPSVAEAAASTFGHHLPLARLGQVANQFTGVHVMHDRAAWNHDVKILARPARLVTAGAWLPAFGPKLPRNTEIRECVHRRVCDKINAAAMTAVAAVRTAPLDVLLAPEAQAAVAAVAGLHANGCFVDEFHGLSLQKTPLEAGLLGL